MIEYLLFLFFFGLFISFLFSGSEAAIFSLTSERVNKLNILHKNKSRVNIDRLSLWLKEPEKTLSAILLGNLAANIFISQTGHDLITHNLKGTNLNVDLYSLLIITLTILLFAEIMPKVIALQVAEKWSLFLAPLLQKWFSFVNSFSWPIYQFTTYISSYWPQQKVRLNEKELLDSIQLAESYGVLKPEEREFLNRSVAFHHHTVSSVMIPRSNVFMVPYNSSILKLKKMFKEKFYRFAIVYKPKDHQILGFLHVKNLILMLYKKQKSIMKKIHPIIFVPETMPLKFVLENMIENKIEMAAVVNELGEFSGILTLKNLLHKLIGKWDFRINAEKFVQEQNIRRSGENTYRVVGSTSLEEFNEFFNVNLKHDNINTISGYIIQQLDGFPRGSTVLNINFPAAEKTLSQRSLYFYDMKIKSNRLENFLVKINVF